MQGVLFLVLLWLSALNAAFGMGIPQIQYMTQEQFVQQAFGAAKPQWKMLMLNAELKKTATDILQHPYRGSRVRYWVDQQRTAWVLDEIGKDLPITIGVVVNGDKIEQVKILVYREERGGEVHQDFFTRQFQSVGLNEEERLTRNIDGITGATLSVHAVTRTANLVLLLHRYVQAKALAIAD